MGRPRDIFAWEQVTPLGGYRWKCKHCGDDFSGAASKIRHHLSGQGNGIAPCPAATETVRNEAGLKKTNQNKRVRLQDPSSASSSNGSNKSVHLQDAFIVSSSNIVAETIARRAVEEHVAAAFLKFLYCNNVPSVANDLVKDPHYMEFVQKASELGFPSSLVWGDSRFMKRTVSRIEYEVNEYIDQVKESWKATGCTRMMFNLKLLPNREDVVTTAFYCPKGIFFAQGKVGKDGYQKYENLIFHSNCITDESYKEEKECIGDEDRLCELTDLKTIEMEDGQISYPWLRYLCVQNEIQLKCIRICHRSKWADELISIAGKIHKILSSSHDSQSWYNEQLGRKRLSFKVLTNNPSPATRFANFTAIQSISSVLASETCINFPWNDDIKKITKGPKFWSEAQKLYRMLEWVMKIGDVMDTFVPTSGYLGLALDEVDRTIERCGLKSGEDALKFWKKLKSELGGDANSTRLGASYLNPVYYLRLLEKDPVAQEQLKRGLNKYDEEVDRYAEEFRKVPADYELEQHHPVEVWRKYGKSLPNLQRLAIKELSRPLSCMCKEVKKHLYQLEGAEDYILRLNVRMMQHFKLLGDDIYKPLDLSPLMYYE